MNSGKLSNLLIVLALLLSTLSVPTAAAAAPALSPDEAVTPMPQSDLSDKVDPLILEELAESGKADFFVVFTDTADLSPAYSMDWSARGYFVVNTLKAVAERSQGNVSKWLTERGIRYTVFWINNSLFVHADQATLEALVAFPEVAELKGNHVAHIFDDEAAGEPEVEGEIMTPAYPWNITFPMADQVHVQYGVKGQGVVVGGMDTGAEYTHMGLVQNYRGCLNPPTCTVFDHTYSWYDPEGICGGAPCDTDGHGTATMGIMAGDDDPSLPAGAWIGMAPDAQWIHCHGCPYGSCPDYDTTACAQWFLAPGGDPDLRPQVVNHSWGTWSPNDCQGNAFQAELMAYRAADIVPAFAAGNVGDACNTSTSPANNTDPEGNPIAFASGAHGIDGSLDYYSSCGWNACNPTKLFPDVASPGLNSCTTSTGNGYFCGFGGTSSASPHTAGCVALVRSANPTLTVAEVEQIIRDAANDVNDTSCGGTEDWNNRYGEGHLDCYEAVQLAGVGGMGTLNGTVTDANTLLPLEDATIDATLTPTRTWHTTTDELGYYEMRVMTGTLTVEAWKYGYVPEVRSTTVVSGVTTTEDFALYPAVVYTVDGTVTDATTGWPLYARIDIDGYPGSPVWTDPQTGYYSTSLAEGYTYTFRVTPWVPGYLPEERPVGPLTGNQTENFSLQPDLDACIAPGYEPQYLYLQDFEAGNGGYAAYGSSSTWEWGVPINGPGSAHSGSNVWATSLAGYYLDNEDSYLESPNIDLGPYAGQGFNVNWWQWLQTESCCDFGEVQVSNDGGASWMTVYGPAYGDTDLTWAEKRVALDASYAVSNFRIRFHLWTDYSVTYPGWYVDDISITGNCQPQPGGLVVGNVYDDNTGLPLNGATVTADTGAATGTAATPEDPNVDDGFYLLFVEDVLAPLKVTRPTGVAPAAAPEANPGITMAAPAGREGAPREPSAHPEDVLWDQPASSTTTAYVDQQFPDFPTFSSYLADDFTNAMPWEITTIFVPGDGWNGFTGLFNATALHWEIYADNGSGVPAGNPEAGGAVWSLTLPPTDPQVVISAGGSGLPSNTALTPAAPVNLPPGNWWFVFYPTMAFSPYGQYGRNPASTTNGTVGQFINPQGGFGLGTAWQDWRVLGHTSWDMAFRLEGTLSAGAVHDLTASMTNYSPDTETVVVPDWDTVVQDFYLGTGELVVDPTSLAVTMDMGMIQTEPLTLTNVGTGDADFDITEVDWGFMPTFMAHNLPVYVPPAIVPSPASGESYAGGGYELPDGSGGIQVPQAPARYTGVDALVYYGDRAAFDADHPGLPIEGFENTLVPDYSIIACDGPFDSATNNACFAPGGILDGIRLMNTTPGNQMVVIGDGALGQPSALVGPNTFVDNQDILFYNEDVYAVGLDLWSPMGAATFDIYIYGPGDVLLGQTSVLAAMSGTFWGVSSNGAITRIHTESMAGAGELFDDIAFGGGGDVPWLSESPISGTVPVADDQLIDVTFDSTGLGQPGDYLAALNINNNTPYGSIQVPVTMTLVPPASYGKIQGTVIGLGYCDGDPAALEGADVLVEGSSGMTWTLTTGAAGGYQVWVDESESPLTILVTHPEHETGEATGVIVTGQQTTTVDFDLRWLQPCLSVTPGSLAATLDMGATETQQITLTNMGAVPAAFDVLEQDRGFEPGFARVAGHGEWLYQAEIGVEMEANGQGSQLAYPKAYRWQPDAPAAGPAILIYADDYIHTAPNTYLDRALQSLGLGYTAHYDGDWTGFEADLTGGTWDLVLVGNDNYGPPDSVFTALDNYVAAGGKLVFHGWTVSWNPSHSLWGTLGITWISDDTDPPDPVYWWQPGHPIFTNPHAVPEFTLLDAGLYGTYGQHVEPLAGLEGVAGYTTPGPDPNMAAMVLANDNRTVFKGFLDGHNSADLDGDTLSDGVELWINVIDGIQAGFAAEVPWLSESPISGTVDADGGQAVVDVTFDAGAVAQPGEYWANLNVVSNDPANGTIAIPVTMTISAPPDWGKLEGTVTGLGYCDGDSYPLEGATVVAQNGRTMTVTTDVDGQYVVWLEEGTYEVTVSAAGHSDGSGEVTITGQQTTTLDFALRSLEPCVSVAPPSMETWLTPGLTETQILTLFNDGAGPTLFEIEEVSGTVDLAITLPPAASPALQSAPRSGVPLSAPVTLSRSARQGECLVAVTAGWDPEQAELHATLDELGFPWIDVISAQEARDAGAAVLWDHSPANYNLPYYDIAAWLSDGFGYIELGDWPMWFPDTWEGAPSGTPLDIVVADPTHPLASSLPPSWTGLGFWAYDWDMDAMGYLVDPSYPDVIQAGYYGSMRERAVSYQEVGDEGRAVYLGVNVYGYLAGDNDKQLLENAILWSGHCSVEDVKWVTEDPITGTVLADDQFAVEVTFTAIPTMALGTYTATLVVRTDDALHPKIAVPITMNIVECLEVTGVDLTVLTASPIFPGDPVDLEADIEPYNATKPYSYSVDYDDGTAPVTGSSSDDPLALTHTFAAPGSYTVAVSVWNCEMTEPIVATAPVVVEEPCEPVTGAGFAWTPLEPVAEEMISFDATVTGGDEPITYTWSFGDGETAVGASVTHAFALAAEYTVWLTATNCGGDGVSAVSHTLTIAEPPYYYYLPIVVKGYTD